MWEFGTIPIEIFLAMGIVLAIELPVTWILANKVNDLIEWIKDHETD